MLTIVPDDHWNISTIIISIQQKHCSEQNLF